jgi:regulator of sigma E protease
MDIVINIILFIITLTTLVGLHELGHFFFARRAGVLCFEYGIGMGPVLYGKQKGETYYCYRALPIGGAVSMAGEEVSDALFKIDSVIGVNLDENSKIFEIILNNQSTYALKGIVKGYDLYGSDNKQLYIDLEVTNDAGVVEVIKYEVSRSAYYTLEKNARRYIAPYERCYESKTKKQRFLIALGGPLMNFILAFLIYLVLCFFVVKPTTSTTIIETVGSGYPSSAYILGGDEIKQINGVNVTTWIDLQNELSKVKSLSVNIVVSRDNNNFTYDIPLAYVNQLFGVTNQKSDGSFMLGTDSVVFETLNKNSRADTDGKLKNGDRIISLRIGNNINKTYINNWDDFALFFYDVDGGTIHVEYERNGVVNETQFGLLSTSTLNKLGVSKQSFQVGISPSSHFDLGYSLLYPFKTMWSNISELYKTLGLLIFAKDIGLGDLSGPVGIFSLVGQASKNGVLSFLSFVAFLSVNLGFMNLLPIPALDGGRILFIGIELVTKKTIKKKLENLLITITFVLLLALMAFVTFQDILRLF